MVKRFFVKARELVREIQAGSDGRVILYAGVTGKTLRNIIEIY